MSHLPLIITLAMLITGVVYFLDKFWLAKRRAAAGIDKVPTWVDYGRSFFPALFAVWIIRSFIMQAVVVPTGSLEPTVMPVEFVAVQQYAYGLRLPLLHTKIFKTGEPHRGDIAEIRWPVKPSVNFIKRVIGLPGDHIVYKDKVLFINGKKMTQKVIGMSDDVEPTGNIPVQERIENLDGVKHKIFVRMHGGETSNFDIHVPKGMYFLMGDNRDNSDDSRDWGFVPDRNLIGRGFMIVLSWDKQKKAVRWSRIGTHI